MKYTGKIIKVKQVMPELMNLTWMINNICPNKCSYCPSSLHDGQNHHYDWENAKKFFKVLFEKYPVIHCSVSGGEPSVSPFFKEIVDIFHAAGNTIGATSNAAKPLHYWKEISPKLQYICFSYHPEFPDKNFIEKITETGKLTYVTARIMMHPNHWDHCIDMYNKILEIKHIFVEPVRIFDWNGGSDPTASQYTDEQLIWFQNVVRDENRDTGHLVGKHKQIDMHSLFYFDNGNVVKPNTVDLINSGLTNFNGYECEVGLKELFIDQHGNVFLGNCMINGSIGNINDPDSVKWPTTPTICTKNLCHCTSSVNINKWIKE